MKILKRILLVIVSLIVLVLVIALFVKKEYTVERQVTINKPVPEVFDYIKHIKNQDNYSVFNKLDPAMKKTHTGTDGTVGFIYAWDSEKGEAGKGEQEIKSIKENERVDMELRFIKPFESVATTYMSAEPAGANQTIVKWGFAGKMPYPMNFMRLFMDIPGMMGDYLQTSLNDLKSIQEK